ncbi:MAG: phage late control D family protein [Deltaproteobacteria bacterium]|nr:phage late control D family protein [Deltaproteobacteria bacterium]
MGAASPNVDILINGNEVSDADFVSYHVERDMFQPDMAAVVLSNQNDIYAGKFEIGQKLEIKVGEDQKSIYVGEIVGFEATYKGGDTTKLTIRALNKMHRLLRKRKSVTYTEKTDEAILKDVVKDGGLTLEWKHKTAITYKHVYQHNQTDLEFLRTRAARLGCHVWCVDTKIHVKEPDFGNSSKVELSVDEGGTLRTFSPRLNSSAVVKKVTVRGWNPETKELITGDASVEKSALGKEDAAAASKDLGKEETFTVDHPIWSAEEAKAIAKARLRDLNLTFITGEAECAGNTEVELGQTIKITANAKNEPDKDPFNGNYYVMGITHRMSTSKTGKDAGFITVFKVARDGQKI